MELKNFRNKYDIELITTSHAGIIIGTLIWDPIIGKPKLDHGGMPDHLFNAFLDADLMTNQEWADFLDEAKNTEYLDAHFAERNIDMDMTIAASLGYPQIGKIEDSFELKKVKQFTFGELKARIMTNHMRVRTDDYLEDLKKNNWDKYDGNVRRLFVITELYYGSLKVVIDSQFKNNLEASIANTDLEVSATVEFGKNAEYTFNHQNVPFAMRIEMVKKFNA